MAMDAIASAAPQAQDFLASSGEAFFGSDLLTAFTDQGQNLAGIFFQASLLPYLLFLYFLSFKANRLPETANFGFQYLLLFVLSTIPSGIITKAVYGTSLANVDWLHGGAESLLTVANILVVRRRFLRLPYRVCRVINSDLYRVIRHTFRRCWD